MVFLSGLIIGAVITFGLIKLSVSRGGQGEFKFCTGCPLKEGFPIHDDDEEEDADEEQPQDDDCSDFTKFWNT